MKPNRMRDTRKHYHKAAGPNAIGIIVKGIECPGLKKDLEIHGFTYVVIGDDHQELIEVTLFYQGERGLMKLMNICKRWEILI